MAKERVVFVHGVATGAEVWQPVITVLGQGALAGRLELVALQRPAFGNLQREIEWLKPWVADAWLVGFSGGATLGLELAATAFPLRGALLHEPAAGSLAPGLLAPVAAAFTAEGFAGFGRALYGAGWTPEMAPEGGATVARELPVFRSFEPRPRHPSQKNTVVSVGANSPQPRQAVAIALRDTLGYPSLTIEGSSHFAPYNNPRRFAAAVTELIGGRATKAAAGRDGAGD